VTFGLRGLAPTPSQPGRAVAEARHPVVRRAELRLRSGYRQQPRKLIVANLGLGDQDAAAKMLDEVGAHRAE
jgi:hypothetical protein